MALINYKMKLDLPGDRWFQVEVVPSGGTHDLEFSISENPLTVSMQEREKILAAVSVAVQAVRTYEGTN